MPVRIIEIHRRRWNPPEYTWHFCSFIEEVPDLNSLTRETRNRVLEAPEVNFKGKMLIENLTRRFFPETDERVPPAADPVDRESARVISCPTLEPEHLLVELRRAFEIRNVEMRFEDASNKRRWQLVVGRHLKWQRVNAV